MCVWGGGVGVGGWVWGGCVEGGINAVTALEVLDISHGGGRSMYTV